MRMTKTKWAAIFLMAAVVSANADTAKRKPKIVPEKTPVLSIPAALFGVEIGKPLALPDCLETGKQPFGPYEGKQEAFCIGPDRFEGNRINRGDGKATLKFPNYSAPEYMLFDVNVTSRGGLVQHVDFATHGLEAQSIVFDTLKGKFGNPSKISTLKMGNMVGASFDVISATWLFRDGTTLKFDGSTGDARFGLVSMSSSAELQIEDKHIEEQEKKDGAPHL